jgi:hypothetical protein
LVGTSVAPTKELKSNLIRRADVSEVTPEMAPVVAEIVNGPSHHPEVWALKFVVA